MVIKRIGPLSFARLTGALYAVLGLVLGVLFSLIALAGGFASDVPGAAGFGGAIGVGAVVVFPLLYGFLGFVMTLIGAWLYNLAAGIVGGVEVDVQ